jgi:hypothetical protein
MTGGDAGSSGTGMSTDTPTGGAKVVLVGGSTAIGGLPSIGGLTSGGATSGGTLPDETMTVTLFAVDAGGPSFGQTYSFSCPSYSTDGVYSADGGIITVGPYFGTDWITQYYPNCTWATTYPNISISIVFTGLQASNAPPVGTYDLSTLHDSAAVPFCIDIGVESRSKIGFSTPHRDYTSSPSPALGTEGFDCWPAVPGGYSVDSGASGTMTITAMDVPFAGAWCVSCTAVMTTNCNWPVYMVQLNNVTLVSPSDQSDGMYPPEVTVNSTFYWEYYCPDGA